MFLETLRSSCFGSEGIHSTAKTAFHLTQRGQNSSSKNISSLGWRSLQLQKDYCAVVEGSRRSLLWARKPWGRGTEQGQLRGTEQPVDRRGYLTGQVSLPGDLTEPLRPGSIAAEAPRAGSSRHFSSFRGLCLI